MKPPPDDVISAGPRAISGPAVWVITAAVLAAALAGAITAAVHYRGEAAALQGRPVRQVTAAPPAKTGPLTLRSGTVPLPPDQALSGELTVFSARATGRLAQMMLSAQISGRPHTRYELIGFDCAGGPAGYQTWAAGVTNAAGRGTLSGRALTVSLSHDYWLYFRWPSQRAGSGLLGRFTVAGKFSASPAGNPACP